MGHDSSLLPKYFAERELDLIFMSFFFMNIQDT